FSIVAHRFGFEGDRQRLAIGAMLFEIHQHQSAREEQVENRTPTLFGRENLLAIEHHQLIGVRSVKRNAASAKAVVAINMAIFYDHAPREGRIVAKLVKRVAEDRQTILAGNMIERAVGVARQPMLRIGTK